MYIHGVAVGGLTTEEAEAALMQHFQPSLDQVTINFTHEGEAVTQLTYKELGITLDFSNAVAAAREYSRRQTLPARVARILGRAHNITEPPSLQHNQEKIANQLKAITDRLQTAPTNASFVYDNGNIAVVPEKSGIAADADTALRQLGEMIFQLQGGTIEIHTSPVAPRYTTADMQFTISRLGAFSTPMAIEDEPRTRNVHRAAERIHNQVIFPGEVFSASALVGVHLPGSDYEPAVVLVRGEPTEDIGGGICQVVTTLYNAVLLSELTVVQRHNHSARVSYADYGFDATIAGDYYDLKFKNNTPHPILIVSRLESNALHVSIHGFEERPANRTIQFSSRRVDIIPPEPYKEVTDATLAPGERVVTLESQLGYRYEVFKHIYIDGQETEEIKVNTSSYRPLQGVISIGKVE